MLALSALCIRKENVHPLTVRFPLDCRASLRDTVGTRWVKFEVLGGVLSNTEVPEGDTPPGVRFLTNGICCISVLLLIFILAVARTVIITLAFSFLALATFHTAVKSVVIRFLICSSLFRRGQVKNRRDMGTLRIFLRRIKNEDQTDRKADAEAQRCASGQ